MTPVRFTLACAVATLGLATGALADCRPGETVLFQCDMAKGGKAVSICLSGSEARYSFGVRGRAPELALSIDVSALPYRLWNGVGRYVEESVTVPNGAVAYVASYAIDRLDPSCNASCRSTGALTVLKNGEELARLPCRAATVVQNIGFLDVADRPAAPAARSCDRAVTTIDMVTCARSALDAADRDVEAAYHQRFQGEDAEGRAILTRSQNAWLAYRDRECERRADTARGGTLAPLLELSCRATLAEERGTALRQTQ